MAEQGQGRVKLVVQVLDDQTASPISNAAVELLNPFDEHVEGFHDFEILTDDRGIITCQPDFDLGETLNELWNGSQVKTAGWRMRVSAPGYLPCTVPLFRILR